MSSTHPLAIVRASSWPELFDCGYRWYAKNILGLRNPSAGASALGTAVHAGTALYDKARLAGEPGSVIDAVDAARAAIANPEEPVAWDDDLTQSDADALAIKLTTKYCTEVAPTRRYRVIEARCEDLDIATRHGIIRVTGTVDRIRQDEDGRHGVDDIKTGSRATEKTEAGGRRAVTKGHHLQLGIYTLMAEQATGLRMEAPAAIVGLQTTKDVPWGIGEVADVKTPLVGTDDAPGLIEIAAHMLSEGLFPPNPKSFLCSKKYCPAHGGACKYHD